MDDYERYAELLIYREEVSRDAEAAGNAYLREFGKMLEDTFSANIEAIKLKKLISAYQAALNCGEMPDAAAIQEMVDRQMKPYYEMLKKQQEKNKKAHQCSGRDNWEFEECKKIYRRLMKLLHPDMSPLTEQHPELMDLFNDIQLAYKCVDWSRLQELEVIVNAKLKELGIETVVNYIPNLDKKIEDLEEEINRVISSTPYTYRDMLADPAQMLEHSAMLEKQYNEAVAYRDELAAKFDELKEGC